MADEPTRLRAYQWVSRTDLAPAEKSAFFVHELTGCDGLEFVAFSNAQLTQTVALTGHVVLAPCFLADLKGRDSNNALVIRTMEMSMAARFIYDGWVPILEWNLETVRRAVRSVNEALSVFSLYGRTHFDWQPKYPVGEEIPPRFKFEDAHLTGLEAVAKLLERLKDKDRVAIYRSFAWLSQGLRLNEPEAHFLCCILAIESLATYIEAGASASSLLVKLRTDTLSKKERQEKQSECIHGTLAKLLEGKYSRKNKCFIYVAYSA